MLRFRLALFAVAFALFALPLVAQSSYSTGFEPPEFVLGDIDGQNGWGHLSNSPTGGEIVPVPAGSPAVMQTQSLAIKTIHSDFFGVTNHLYSPTIDPAGETGSTIGGVVVANPQTHFFATFDYRTPTTPIVSSRADGRFAELNPSSKGTAPGDAANRYAQIRLFNNGDGTVRVEIGWYTSSGFTVAQVALLQWGTWYRFDVAIHLVDGLAGAEPNDLFSLKIYDLAGNLVGSACGSTWELGWKGGTFGGGSTPRGVNGFDLWAVTAPDGTVVGHIDNFSMSTSSPAVTALAVSISGSNEICSGTNTALTANVTGGDGPVSSYVWTDATNTVVGNSQTVNLGPGTYSVTVNDAFCAAASSQPFTVGTFSPAGVSISGNLNVPHGAMTTLTANVTGGSGTITSYDWREASNNIVATSSTLAAGAGTYTVTVTDDCGPVTSAPATVIEAEPTPTISEWGLILMGLVIAAIGVART